MRKKRVGNPVRVGVIGAGRIVELAHLPVLSALPDVEVVALYDQDENRAETLAREFSIPQTCERLEDLFILEPDAILVACPNSLHARMSIAALEAGAHVLCEKPIATRLAEAEAMVEASGKANRELMIGSTNRFRPEILELEKAIREKKLGEIEAIRCGWLRRKGIPGIGTWFTTRQQAGGGVLTDLGSHLLDLAIWLGGRRRLLSVQCVTNRSVDTIEQAAWYAPPSLTSPSSLDVEVSASAFAVFEGPLNMFIEVSWASAVPNDLTYLQVMGSRGVARLETLFGLSPQGNRPEYPLQVWVDGSPLSFKGTPDLLQPYRDEWRFFLESIRNGRSLHPWLYDGLAMMELIEAMYRSDERLDTQRSLLYHVESSGL